MLSNAVNMSTPHVENTVLVIEVLALEKKQTKPVVLQDVDDNRGQPLAGDPHILHGRTVKLELHKVPEAEQGGKSSTARESTAYA